MLHNALVFLVAALVAGVLGFTGIAGSPLGVARVLCLTFAGLCVLSLSMMRSGKRRPARAMVHCKGRAARAIAI